MARATAGYTPFHEPTYKGSFQVFAGALLKDAKLGRLKVCDQGGSEGTADELIAEAERAGTLCTQSRYMVEPDWERLKRDNEPVSPGVWHFGHLDLGPTETDWAMTHISALHTMLKWLNDWGATMGHEFTLNHDGIEWFDERGILVGRAAPHGERDALPTEGRNTGLLDAPPSDAPVVAVAGVTVVEPDLADTPTAHADAESMPARAGGHSMPLTTPQMADAFDGIDGRTGQKWRELLGDLNNHQWALPARAAEGKAPKPATWWPVILAGLLLKRGTSSDPLNHCFLTMPTLKAWLPEWQEERRTRNAFGQ